MTRPNPHGCPRCGRLECKAPARRAKKAHEMWCPSDTLALRDCESHPAVDWQAECRALTPDAETLAAAGEVLRLAEGIPAAPWKSYKRAPLQEPTVEFRTDGHLADEGDFGGIVIGALWWSAARQRTVDKSDECATFIAAVRTLAPHIAAWVANRGGK